MKQPAPITHGDCSELRWNLPSAIATYTYAADRREGVQRLEVVLERSVRAGRPSRLR
jgi:hypothetical protein